MRGTAFAEVFLNAAILLSSRSAVAQPLRSIPGIALAPQSAPQAAPATYKNADGEPGKPNSFESNYTLYPNGQYKEESILYNPAGQKQNITVQGKITPNPDGKNFDLNVQNMTITESNGASHPGTSSQADHAGKMANIVVGKMKAEGNVPWLNQAPATTPPQPGTQPQQPGTAPQTAPANSGAAVEWQGDNPTARLGDGRIVEFNKGSSKITVKDPTNHLMTVLSFSGSGNTMKLSGIEQSVLDQPERKIAFFNAYNGVYQIRGRQQPVTQKANPRDTNSFYPVPEDLKQSLSELSIPQTILAAQQAAKNSPTGRTLRWSEADFPGVGDLAVSGNSPQPTAQNSSGRLETKPNGEATYFDAEAEQTRQRSGWIVNASQNKNNFYLTDLANNVRTTVSYYVNVNTGERGLSMVGSSNGHSWNPRSKQPIPPDLQTALNKAEEAQTALNGTGIAPANRGPARQQPTPQQQLKQ